MKLDLPRFSQKVVAELSGIQPKTMQTWLNRGLLKPQGKPGPGTGHHRLYSAQDVLGFVVLGRLTKLGITGPKACQVAQGIRNRCDLLHEHMDVQRERDGDLHVFISYSAKDHFEKLPLEMPLPEAPACMGFDFSFGDDAGRTVVVQLKKSGCLQECQGDTAVIMNISRMINQTLSDLDSQSRQVSIG